jgi:hypothetical protein
MDPLVEESWYGISSRLWQTNLLPENLPLPVNIDKHDDVFGL